MAQPGAKAKTGAPAAPEPSRDAISGEAKPAVVYDYPRKPLSSGSGTEVRFAMVRRQTQGMRMRMKFALNQAEKGVEVGLHSYPFLLFDGNCAEAMTFYQECLGGELTLTKLVDTPMREQFPPEKHGRIINASPEERRHRDIGHRLDGLPHVRARSRRHLRHLGHR